MARFLDEKLIQKIDIEIAFINYGATVKQLFGFKEISSLEEMQTMILTAPDKLQSKFARFGHVLQYLDLRVFNQVSMDTSKHVIFITDKVYDSMNLKVNNGLLRLKRKGIKYHWVLIGEQSNVSTPGDTYLVNDYPSLTDNYDIIDDITTDIALDDSEYSEALVPKTVPSETGTLQNSQPTKIIIAFRSGSSTSPPEFFKKLLPFINSFIDRSVLSEANTDIAVVNYGKAVNLVFGFQQLSFDEMTDTVSGISKKYRSKFSRFPLVIEYINQELLVPPAVADTDDRHVVFIADQLYEKLDSGIRKGIEHLETRGIHTHWVLIGDNSAIPTTSVAYKVADYEELQQRQDISVHILSDITQGKRYAEDVNVIPTIPNELTTRALDSSHDNSFEDNIDGHGNEIPNIPAIEPDTDERNVKVVIVFRTGSGTSPKDFYRHLLPFVDSFLLESSAMPEVNMEFSVINYGKSVTKIIGFKEYNIDELHGIILGISKKFRSRFARFQNLLEFLRQSVFTPDNVLPGDEKHVIFITDKVYDTMDDSIEKGIDDLETTGVMTHWVTIGTQQTIPTRGHVYSTQTYSGLSDFDVFAANFKILADIFTEPGARDHTVSTTTMTLPTTIPEMTTKETRYAKIVVVFRSGSSTSPRDYFQHLLPFIDTFVNNVYTDQVQAEYSVINYGKSVSQLFGFKDFDASELQSIILGMSKKYRSKFARFQQLLQFLRQSVFIPSQVSDGDEKHVIFITDKIYDKMDDELLNELRDLENGGVTTHWVLIGQDQEIPTQGIKYHIADYQELSDTTDIPVPYKILTEIQYNRQTTPRALSTEVTKTTEVPTPPTTTASSLPGGTSGSVDVDSSLADIAFLFHASNKVSKKAFKKGYIKFLIRMIKKCKLDKGRVKAALATYGKKGQLLFNLNAFSKKKPAMKFIRKLPKNLRFKKADLAKGLRLVREEIFVDPFDRPGAPNYLVVVTDSPSDDGIAEALVEAEILKDQGVHIYMVSIGDIGEEMLVVPSEPFTENSKQLLAYTDLANFKKSGKSIMKKIPALKRQKKKKDKKKTTIIPTSTSTTESSTSTTLTSGDITSTDPTKVSTLVSTTLTSGDITSLFTSPSEDTSSVATTPAMTTSTTVKAQTTELVMMTSPPDEVITTDTILSTTKSKQSTERAEVTSPPDSYTTITSTPRTEKSTEVFTITTSMELGMSTTPVSTKSSYTASTREIPQTTPVSVQTSKASTRFSSASLPESVTSSSDTASVRTLGTTTSGHDSKTTSRYFTTMKTPKSTPERVTTKELNVTSGQTRAITEYSTSRDQNMVTTEQGMSPTTDIYIMLTDEMTTDDSTDKEMKSSVTTSSTRYTDGRTPVVNKMSTEAAGMSCHFE